MKNRAPRIRQDSTQRLSRPLASIVLQPEMDRHHWVTSRDSSSNLFHWSGVNLTIEFG